MKLLITIEDSVECANYLHEILVDLFEKARSSKDAEEVQHLSVCIRFVLKNIISPRQLCEVLINYLIEKAL